MNRKIGTILFVLYAIVAITVTVLLLSYNDYNCSELAGYTVFIVNDDSLESAGYKQGDILLIKKSSDKAINVGDDLFIYNVINSQEFEVVHRNLLAKVQQGRHTIYRVEDEESYSSEYCIGKASNTTVIKGWGTLLSILESKWGYLFCIVIVSLLLFLQEVFDLVMEIKYGGNKAEGNTTKATTTTKTNKVATVAKVAKAVKTVSNENNQEKVKEE